MSKAKKIFRYSYDADNEKISEWLKNQAFPSNSITRILESIIESYGSDDFLKALITSHKINIVGNLSDLGGDEKCQKKEEK